MTTPSFKFPKTWRGYARIVLAGDGAVGVAVRATEGMPMNVRKTFALGLSAVKWGLICKGHKIPVLLEGNCGCCRLFPKDWSRDDLGCGRCPLDNTFPEFSICVDDDAPEETFSRICDTYDKHVKKLPAEWVHGK